MAAESVDLVNVVQQLEDPEALELIDRLVESELTLLESRLVQLRELHRSIAAQREPEVVASAARAAR